ncbi:MAG: OB-fold nucleic acid binding domain-containing protein [Bacteroidetes bacterium]|nr:OB-fold nucleic acid binding domain-containing protein [Bacteroidota bacterium]
MTRKSIKTIAIAAVTGLLLTAGILSCKKDNFSMPAPGANSDPAGIQATMTIKEFKQKFCSPHSSNYLPYMLDTDVVISGIVNADDHSGNFYKIIAIQDSTGGIQMKIGSSFLYQDYPIGRRIFVKVKGLLFYNYSGTYELGGYIDTTTSTYPNVGPIVIDQAPRHIIKGQWGLDVPVKHLTIPQLNIADWVNLQSMLIQIDSVEFAPFDTTQTWADNVSKASVNRTLTDCAHHTIIVRTSGYAGFANQKPNPGHGNLRGLYTYYSISRTPQIVIRDTSDVMFTSAPRCH